MRSGSFAGHFFYCKKSPTASDGCRVGVINFVVRDIWPFFRGRFFPSCRMRCK